MNELRELKALEDLGMELEPPAGPPETLRWRVISRTERQPSRPARSRSRLGIAVGTVAATAAVVLGVQLIPGTAGTADAAEVLRGAASQAQAQAVADGGQFVYVESAVESLTMTLSTPDSSASVDHKKRQVWLSVDGTRDGLVREQASDGTWTTIELPGCRDGSSTVEKGGKSETVACTPAPAYQSGLPTDADAMLDYLRQQGKGTKNPVDQQAFVAAADLLREGKLSPAVASALFHAVAKIPSATVVGEAADEAGRKGIAVASTQSQGTRTELIFAPETFDYLGQRTVLLRDQDGLSAGQVVDSSAVLKIAVVDQAGQSPR